MSLKRTQSSSTLDCDEFMENTWIKREATPEEILKLKPVMMNTFDYQCVAGGFAAYVEGVTTTYDDIDIFKNNGVKVRRGIVEPYKDMKITRILNNGAYQTISMIYDGWFSKDRKEMQERFAKWVLQDFDLIECKVAYYYYKGKYYYIRQNVEYCKQNVLALQSGRMRKYNARAKTPKSLKWLALTEVKTHYDKSDVETFINKIDIEF
jgi:hypothetical protein